MTSDRRARTDATNQQPAPSAKIIFCPLKFSWTFVIFTIFTVVVAMQETSLNLENLTK